VARMMRRLELVPWLSNISLVTSATTTIGNSTVYQFTIKGALVTMPAGATS
jgi:hypothetical protein